MSWISDDVFYFPLKTRNHGSKNAKRNHLCYAKRLFPVIDSGFATKRGRQKYNNPSKKETVFKTFMWWVLKNLNIII